MIRILHLTLLFILFLLSGCTKEGSLTRVDFKSAANQVVEIYMRCIEHLVVPGNATRTFINEFYETDFDEEAEKIKTRIMNVEYYYLGKTNFKQKEDQKNKELFAELTAELDSIKKAIEKYPNG